VLQRETQNNAKKETTISEHPINISGGEGLWKIERRVKGGKKETVRTVKKTEEKHRKKGTTNKLTDAVTRFPTRGGKK